MKNGYIYTVIFMFILSAVFTAFLAGANAMFLPQIKQNEDFALKNSVLYVLDIENDGDKNEINNLFDKNIEKKTLGGMEVFIKYDENKNVSGYAVPFSGGGLWGTITGYLGVSQDLKNIIGIDFISQSETPGLGGRIGEDWYKEQFRGLKINVGNKVSYGNTDGNKLDAVTGATITSNAVLNIVNGTIDNNLKSLEVAK